jgi:hypothetical protein
MSCRRSLRRSTSAVGVTGGGLVSGLLALAQQVEPWEVAVATLLGGGAGFWMASKVRDYFSKNKLPKLPLDHNSAYPAAGGGSVDVEGNRNIGVGDPAGRSTKLGGGTGADEKIDGDGSAARGGGGADTTGDVGIGGKGSKSGYEGSRRATGQGGNADLPHTIAGPERNVWLCDAIHFVASRLWLDRDPTIEDYAKAIPFVDEVMQAAIDGKLTIWGKTMNEAAPYEKLEPRYWHEFRLDEFGFAHGREMTRSEWRKHHGVPPAPGLMRELMTNREQVGKLWPPLP